MERLTIAERSQILAVLERDVELQKQEEQRIMLAKLAVSMYQNELKEKAQRLSKKNDDILIKRRCHLCYAKLGVFKETGVLCGACKSRTCSKCIKSGKIGEGGKGVLLCHVCFLNREYSAISGSWFHTEKPADVRQHIAATPSEQFVKEIKKLKMSSPLIPNTVKSIKEDRENNRRMSVQLFQRSATERRQSLATTPQFDISSPGSDASNSGSPHPTTSFNRKRFSRFFTTPERRNSALPQTEVPLIVTSSVQGDGQPAGNFEKKGAKPRKSSSVDCREPSLRTKALVAQTASSSRAPSPSRCEERHAKQQHFQQLLLDNVARPDVSLPQDDDAGRGRERNRSKRQKT